MDKKGHTMLYIKIKNSLFYSGDKSKYKLYRNKRTELIRLSKKAYYQEYFTTNLANQKRTWEGINKLINRRRKARRPIAALKCPISEKVASNPSEISNKLYLTNTFQQSVTS